LDETSYSGGSMGADHPIAWCQLYDGGRSWYTAGGHTRESYAEPLFRQHLLGGIQFTSKIRDGACAALTGASAASFKSDALAGESIASLFGSEMATDTEAAPRLPLPTTLAGVSVRFRDSAGNESLAPLFYVSPKQINLIVPANVENGESVFTVIKSDSTAPSGAAQIATIAPGLFSANASGEGVAVGYVTRIRGNGARVNEPITRFDAAQNRYVAVPIDLGLTSDKVFLVLFGTGFNRLASLSNAKVKTADLDLPALYAGVQSEFAGVGQINVLLPKGLAGRGEVAVEFMADGQSSNVVKINLR
jgi:uncharacterized protein (TIGR03437 family)